MDTRKQQTFQCKTCKTNWVYNKDFVNGECRICVFEKEDEKLIRHINSKTAKRKERNLTY